MENVIIFGSKYGSTKSYAQELTKKTGVPNIDYRQIECLEKYSTIIYLGGLYAGGVIGLKGTFKKFPLNSKQKLIVITVGLGNPKIITNKDRINNALKKQLQIELYDNCKIFYLRGAIDYQKLSVKHKIMMRALFYKINKLPVAKQTAETQELINTFSKNVNFVDFETLKEIIDYI